MQKKWIVKEKHEAESRALASAIGVSTVIADILLHRGISEPQAAELFLHPERQAYADPFSYKDMDKAVGRILLAIERQEKIVIYGDYDVDGITSTTLLMRNLSAMGANADYYIPNRQTEGYGFNKDALEAIYKDGAKLIVSVDCGISAVEEVSFMEGKLDIVITDHHLPQQELPPALAVVNPHRIDCTSEEKNLAGVGVAFKLCQALWKRSRGIVFEGDLEIVALGTIADMVPLLGENRRIVKAGLDKMQHTEILGLKALIEASGLKDKQIREDQVGFVLAPRLNAAGRIGTAGKGVELLLAEDAARASAFAGQLNDENAERQLLEHHILELAERQLQKVDAAKAHALVLAGDDWHPGVIGIVASRIVDKYYRPVVVIGIKDGIGKGSCRSIRGFHMYKALEACRDHLLGFGGHAQAAGLSLQADQIDAFRQALDAYAAAQLQPDDFIPSVEVEQLLPIEEVTMDLIHELETLAPFGMGNPRPLFGCRNVRGAYAKSLGAQGQHLRFSVDGREGESISAIGWNMSEQVALVNQEPVDVVYSPEINEWRGRQNLQCKLQALSPSLQLDKFPSREMLAGLYVFLRQQKDAAGKITADKGELWRLYQQNGASLPFYSLETGLSIFCELGLLETAEDGNYFMGPPPAQKLELMESYLYRQGIRNKC